MWLDRAHMDVESALRTTNRNMIAFDLALGSGALFAPDATLAALGHERPSPDARELFRRSGPVWLTFAAAHAVTEIRGRPEDWWALAWLRGTELATDILWSRSSAFTRPGARAGLWLAGVGNLAMAVGFGWLATRRPARRRLSLRRR
ncbi:MAG: hypothetical protein E6G49_00025 [Actinobacteria bacterium]|nr:MAG: hypothetical protein E6G49_00025 [Actinomycetota bacterium]